MLSWELHALHDGTLGLTCELPDQKGSQKTDPHQVVERSEGKKQDDSGSIQSRYHSRSVMLLGKGTLTNPGKLGQNQLR